MVEDSTSALPHVNRIVKLISLEFTADDRLHFSVIKRWFDAVVRIRVRHPSGAPAHLDICYETWIGRIPSFGVEWGSDVPRASWPLSRDGAGAYDLSVRMALAAVFALLGSAGFGLATPASAAPADPPAATEQHVTVPSLPGQPNKDTVVRPSGSLKTDGNGWVVTKPAAGGAPTAPPALSGQLAPARGAPVAAPRPKVGPAPSAPTAATGNSRVTIRGVVEAVSPSRSVTIRRASSGSVVTYALAPGAAVPTGLKPGERVKLRVLALERGRVADRVERLKRP